MAWRPRKIESYFFVKTSIYVRPKRSRNNRKGETAKDKGNRGDSPSPILMFFVFLFLRSQAVCLYFSGILINKKPLKSNAIIFIEFVL
jgi:hypothetical protein